MDEAQNQIRVSTLQRNYTQKTKTQTTKMHYLVNIDEPSARVVCYFCNQSVGRHHRVNHMRIETDRERRVQWRRRQHIDLARTSEKENTKLSETVMQEQRYRLIIQQYHSQNCSCGDNTCFANIPLVSMAAPAAFAQTRRNRRRTSPRPLSARPPNCMSAHHSCPA